MTESSLRLGIDFGTSNTVAVIRWPDGRTRGLLFDGSPLLPSAVYVSEDGSILSGRDAVHSARLHPHRFEPYPKRRIDESVVYLGDREIPSTELIGTVLRRVAVEAQRVAGAQPTAVTLTHPAAWGGQRRDALTRAAAGAGLGSPLLVAEPVAAASYFVGAVGTHLPIGHAAVVYDFGAGTFDATVVRRTAAGGFDVLSTEGLTDAGGLDVDAAIVTYLGEQLAEREPDKWRRLSQPADDTDRRAAWQLWEDARQAKETLSRTATTYVHVPLINDSVPIGREQLERLAHPILDQTVTATLLAVTSAGLTPARLAAVFLVGGSSRIPLAATLLHRAFGTAPTAIEQPELVVAEGALQLAPKAGRATVGPVPRTPPAGPPMSGPPMSGPPMSGPPMSGPLSGGAPTSGPPMPVPPGQPTHGQPPQTQPPQTQPPQTLPPQTLPPQTLPRPPGGGWPQVSSQPALHPAVPAVPLTHPARRRSGAVLVGGLLAAAVVLIVLAGFAVYALLPADGPPKPDPTKAAPACGYKIAYLGILSGEASEDGKTMRNAARLALQRYNAAHPGCTAELVEYDTKGEPDEAARLADQLVKDDRMVGVVGPIWYTDADKVMPILDAAGISVVSPSLSHADLSQRGWKTFHRTIGTDVDQAGAGARYLTGVLRAQRVFIVADNDQYGSAVAAEVRLRLNTTAAGRAEIVGNETSYADVISRISSATADAVYFAGYYDAAGVFVKQLRAAKPGIRIVGWDRIFTGAFVTGAGSAAAEGVVITCPCVPPTEARENFEATFKQSYGEAGYYGPEAYDAANVLLSALNAGKATRSDVLTHVSGYQGDGVARRITFTPGGDLSTGTAGVWAYQVRDGGVYKDQRIPTG